VRRRTRGSAAFQWQLQYRLEGMCVTCRRIRFCPGLDLDMALANTLELELELSSSAFASAHLRYWRQVRVHAPNLSSTLLLVRKCTLSNGDKRSTANMMSPDLFSAQRGRTSAKHELKPEAGNVSSEARGEHGQ